MKIEDIYLKLLFEQENDNGIDYDDLDDAPEDNNDNGEDVNATTDNVNQEPIQKKVKPLSEIDKIKLKWKEENPGLSDTNMNDTIDFFNRRKNGLREYKDPATTQNYVNMPEIVALMQRFPGMVDTLSNHQKIRDLQNYTWEQMEYFMDRAGTNTAVAEMDFSIEGDTPETRKASAYKKWDKTDNRVVDENNIRIFRITGKDESIGLGRLQHILVKEAQERTGNGGFNWCITNAPGMSSSNLYTTYRGRRAFYFVLDRNRKDDDKYYVSVISAIDMSGAMSYEGPYVVTPRPNGDETGKSWDDIVRIYPQLEGKQNLFKFFGPTNKETVDISIDKITFREHSPYDFAIQKLDIQQRFIDTGRLINNKRAFSVLPDKLRKDYIARTTLEDYKNRYKCDDSRDPFGMLTIIEKESPGLYTFLDQKVLKTQLHLIRGVNGIREAILGLNYRRGFLDIESDKVLFMEKNGTHYGVMDIKTTDWVKPIYYFKSTTNVLVKVEKDSNGQQQRIPYLFQRYATNEGDDYFYFLLKKDEYLNKNSQNYMKGKYYNKPEGDSLLNSGEFRKVGY